MKTQNLKEALDLALTGVSIVVDAEKDGKIDVSDLGLLLKLVPLISPAIDGLGEIPAELSDLDASEAQELVAHVVAKLVVTDPKAIAVIDASLKLLTGAISLIAALKLKEA